MKNYDSFKYSCLFGGGAVRGAAHVGVIKALDELGITPDIYAGSSVGSIVAVLWAVGYSYEELSEIFLSVNFELFRDISFGFNTKFAFSKGDIFLNWIKELIEKKFYGDKYSEEGNPAVKFKDINKNLVIITTNIKNFTCNEFSTFTTPDFEIAMAVRISCCMPGLMRAISLENKLLVDGDLMKGKPMWSLSEYLKKSDSRILEVRLEGSFDGSDTNPIEYVNGMYSCITYTETDFIRNIYKDCDKYDCLAIDTGNVIVVDFNYPVDKRQDIIDAGYNQTINYMTKILPVKKDKLCKIYKNILVKVRKVQEYMLRGRYNSAKCSVAELFIILSDCWNMIDCDIYSGIKEFQELLYSNVKTGLLGSRCINKSEVFDKLKDLIESLLEAVNDLEKYIDKFSV